MIGCCFFFFKQKTAYEMRISDWSSDVCSSDLQVRQLHHREERLLERILDRLRLGQQRVEVLLDLLRYRQRLVHRACDGHVDAAQPPAGRGIGQQVVGQQRVQVLHRVAVRSEEHTSELQSLMRISYAVFCLKKKKIDKDTHNHRVR